MPRSVVYEPPGIERLSILDEDGKVDRELEPDIPKDVLREMYRAMLWGRRFDERMLKLQRQGRIGTFAPIKGQEAAQIGSAIHLRAEDWLVPSFRETAAQLWRGATPEDIWLFAAGYNEGVRIPAEAHDLPLCVPVATQLLQACGIAYAEKLRGTDTIVMAFHGDGATSEGDFHEAMNFAAVYGLPVVFVCQNNQWAISVPLAKQTKSQTLAQKAIAYEMPGIQVDGNDVLAVWEATRVAVERARAGNGPTLIECVTYRMEVHTTADDPTRYRTEEDVAPWRKRDPLERFESYLVKKKAMKTDEIKAMDEAFKRELLAAWHKTEKHIVELDAVDPISIFDDLYEQSWPHLEEQKAYFRARQAKEAGRG